MDIIASELVKIAKQYMRQMRVGADTDIFLMSKVRGNLSEVLDSIPNQKRENGVFEIRSGTCNFDAHDNVDYCYRVKYRGKVVRIHNKEEENRKSLLEYMSPEEVDEVGSWATFQRRKEVLLADPKIAVVLINNDSRGYVSENNIVGLEYAGGMEDYEEDPYPSSIDDQLSTTAQKWLEKFMSSAGGKNPPKAVRDELTTFRLNRPVVLYRGMGWYENELRMLRSVSYPFKKGKILSHSYKRPSSWTSNKFIAKSFAKGTGDYWIVIACKVDPKDVLVDTRLLPDEVLMSLYRAKQREVILMKGNYKARIETIGYKNDDDLDIGWVGNENKPDQWGEIEKAFDILQRRLGKPWVTGTPRKHYNGLPGVMSGRFNDKDTIVVFAGEAHQGKYDVGVDVWIGGSCYQEEKWKFDSLSEVAKFVERMNEKRDINPSVNKAFSRSLKRK